MNWIDGFIQLRNGRTNIKSTADKDDDIDEQEKDENSGEGEQASDSDEEVPVTDKEP